MTDTTPPNLSSFSFTSVFDLSNGDKPLSFTPLATDDASGVGQVSINFAKPITYGFPNSSSLNTSTSLFLSSDGQSTSNFTLSKFNAPGSYAIDSLVVTDKVGNRHTYSASDLAALGSPTAISVTGA